MILADAGGSIVSREGLPSNRPTRDAMTSSRNQTLRKSELGLSNVIFWKICSVAILARDGSQIMSSLDGKRVLVVEDEYFLADELTEAIQASGGLVVGPFAKASEAEQALNEGVEVAVLNVRVRDGLTYPLAALLRERGIPFVFASGQANDTEPQEWRSSPWISKPYHPNDVIGWLVRAFAAK